MKWEILFFLGRLTTLSDQNKLWVTISRRLGETLFESDSSTKQFSSLNRVLHTVCCSLCIAHCVVRSLADLMERDPPVALQTGGQTATDPPTISIDSHADGGAKHYRVCKKNLNKKLLTIFCIYKDFYIGTVDSAAGKVHHCLARCRRKVKKELKKLKSWNSKICITKKAV